MCEKQFNVKGRLIENNSFCPEGDFISFTLQCADGNKIEIEASYYEYCQRKLEKGQQLHVVGTIYIINNQKVYAAFKLET